MNGDADSVAGGEEGQAPPPPGLAEALELAAPGPTSTTTSTRPSRMTFEERLRTMFLNGELKHSADLRVMVQGDDGKAPMYRLHKELFWMASPVFESLLKASDGGSYSIKLEIHTSVFQFVRHFLYADDLPDRQTLDMDMKLKILRASLQYEIDRLIDNVLGKIKESMRKEDAFKVLQSGREHELCELESLALEMIFKNGEELLSNAHLEEFCTLGQYDVCRILSSDCLECRELTAFNAALRWAKEKAKYTLESKARKTATKYYFSQVATCVRFPLLTPTELAQVTARDDILDDHELVKLFHHALLPPQERNKISLKFESRPRSCQGDLQRNNMPPPAPPLPNGNLPHIPVRKRQLSGDNNTVADCATTTSSATPTSSTTGGKRIRFQVDQNGCDFDGEEDLFHLVSKKTFNTTVNSYEDLCRRHFKEELYNKVLSVEISKNVTITQLYRSPTFPNCKELVLDAKLSFIREDDEDNRVRDMKNFIRYFDPMRYIVFHTKNSTQPLTAVDIWSMGQNILLKFNGVTFLKAIHARADGHIGESQSQSTKMGGTLVLNYMRDSRAILSNDQLRPQTLAISNCEFSSSSIKEKGRTQRIETLILYHCWGDWLIDEIMKDYPNLKELVLWKYTPRSSANTLNFRSPALMTPLCMNFSHVFTARNTIRKIVLFQSELKFPVRVSNAATTVSELHLDGCHVSAKSGRGAHISEVFPVVFPKLKRFFLKDKVSQSPDPAIHGNLATPDLINSVRKKIPSIEWFRVVGLKWNLNDELGTNEVNGSLDEAENHELKSFLQNIDILPISTNFLLEKSNDMWKGVDYEDKQKESISVDEGYHSYMDKMEYEWYSLNYFYASYQIFEDYFIADAEGFPQPVLWT